MGEKARRNQPWSASIAISAGAGTTAIKAAPGANRKLVVTLLQVRVVVTAAQTASFQDASGANVLAALAASEAAGTRIDFESENGIPLTANEAFRYVPSAAGYALSIWAEGYITFTGDLSS